MNLLSERIENKIKKLIKYEDERYAGLEHLDSEIVKDIIRFAFMDGMRMGYNECSMLTQRSYRSIFKFKGYLKKDNEHESNEPNKL